MRDAAGSSPRARPGGRDGGGLEVRDAVVRYGDHVVLDGLSVAVGAGEIVGVLGPSGCGKSTLLRAIAGLQPLDAGTVSWAGDDLAPVPPHRRGFGLVFQDHALFPHRSVGDNVAFGLRMHGVRRPERTARVAEVLALVGLDGYDGRSVGTLSGGEAQRVALARALAPRPRLLMLDEPLASLDRSLRDRLAAELPELLRAEGVAAIHVTHDQSEAFAVADRVAVVRDGVVVAAGRPERLWHHPGDAWVARFLGLANVWPTTVAGGRAVVPGGSVPVGPGVRPGGATVVVRPDGWSPVAVGADGAVGGADVHGVVTSRTFRGDHEALVVTTSGGPVAVTARWPHLPAVGEAVALVASPAAVTVLPPEVGTAAGQGVGSLGR